MIADYRYLITHKLRCYQCYCVFNSFVYKEVLSYNRTPATATDMANFEHVLKMCTKSLPALNIGVSFQRDMERSKLVENNSIMFLIYYLAWKCGIKRAGTAIIASVSCRIFENVCFWISCPFKCRVTVITLNTHAMSYHQNAFIKYIPFYLSSYLMLFPSETNSL